MQGFALSSLVAATYVFVFFFLCCALNQATCPSLGQPSLLPTEITKYVEERLSKPDMMSESSGAFRESLEKFLEKCVKSIISTRTNLGLPLDVYGGLDQEVLEDMVANISGLTSRQLEVRDLSLFTPSIIV